MYNILLVEDEAGIQFANKAHLERSGGYTVRTAMNLAEARQSITESVPDLIVLDIMLPDGSGLDFLNELRQAGNNLPILLLTALSEADDQVKGLRAGGNDYLTKPYDNSVLIARIESALRTASKIPVSLSVGNVKIDTASKRAYVGDVDMGLNIKEFSLLEQFIQHPEQMLTTSGLYEKVWGQKMIKDNTALKTAISRLRAKLSELDAGYTITFSKGEGYYFEQV